MIYLGIPLKKMERINFILDCVEKEKVILSKPLLHKVGISYCDIVLY